MSDYTPVEVGVQIRMSRETAAQVQEAFSHEYDPACPFCRMVDGLRAEVGLRPRKGGKR